MSSISSREAHPNNLPQGLLHGLIKIQEILDGGVAESLRDLVNDRAQAVLRSDIASDNVIRSVDGLKKYSAEFIGIRISGWTLPEIFSTIVDMTFEVAPEVVDKLATLSSRRRRFVSRTCDGVHPGRQDLSVMQTGSGWWISKNIGQEDLRRGLRALAQAAGLTYGIDVKFNAGDLKTYSETSLSLMRDGSGSLVERL